MQFTVCENTQASPPTYILVFLALFLVFIFVDFVVTTVELGRSVTTKEA